MFASLIGLFSCGRIDLPTVKELDVERYMGTWYEIARLPNSFEKGLDCVSATYTLREDWKITVLNKGRKIEDPDEIKSIKGVAWVPDKDFPGRLKVRFFWPFSGKYWIISLDENYQYALVGAPDRQYLWVLSKSPELEDAVYDSMLEIANKNGFDISKMIVVNQNCRKSL